VPGEGDERHEDEPHEKHEPSRRERMRAWRRRHPRGTLLLVLALLAVLAGAFLLWHHLSRFENTDDAQIDGHIAAVSARVAGNVIGVYVDDHQQVKAGQLLLELDPRDFQVATARAEAELAQAEAQLEGATPQVPITTQTTQTRVATTEDDVANAEAAEASAERDHDAAIAAVREAEANHVRARADLSRAKYLLQESAIPRERYDSVVATARSASAAVDSARARAKAAQKVVDQQQGRLEQARSRQAEALHNAPHELYVQRANIVAKQAAVRAAKAQLERARLDLSYVRVSAPFDGIAGKRSVEPGNRVGAGEELMALVDTHELYVTANFKETQLRHMHVGQPARVYVDALNRYFDGWVESIAAASGARYSLLPPENATGNYVKVVQRIPVRIRLKPNQPDADRLRVGMSVEPRVQVK
jgi:membrane fusion protein (multidrug efflux system)